MITIEKSSTTLRLYSPPMMDAEIKLSSAPMLIPQNQRLLVTYPSSTLMISNGDSLMKTTISSPLQSTLRMEENTNKRTAITPIDRSKPS